MKKDINLELNLGDTFLDNKVKLIVTDSNSEGCCECFYANKIDCNMACTCSKLSIKHNKNVVFKEVENKKSEIDHVSETTINKLNELFKSVIKDMETEEIRFIVPKGLTIDIEKSDIANGKIAFKKKKQIKTWNDLLGKFVPAYSTWIDEHSNIIELFKNQHKFTTEDHNVFYSESHALMALAIAKISQLLPYYGGEVSFNEWNNTSIQKYCIERDYDASLIISRCTRYRFLSFHTEDQANEFLKNNRELCENLKKLG